MIQNDSSPAPGPAQKLRLGIVGCGAISDTSHLPAALASPLVDVVALIDSRPERLRQLERRYDLPDIGFTDYRAALNLVDAVILAVPNNLHAELGIELLSRGIHVLCEKPLAPTLAECKRLCEVARSHSSVLAVGYVTRFFPSTVLTRELLNKGFLGKLISFDYQFGTAGGWAPISGYNLSRSCAGGGVLVVSGSHFLDRMLYLFGRATVISYADDARGGVEADCVAICEFSDHGRPLQGTITLSKTHRLFNRLRIVAENGVLEIREGQSDSVSFFPAGEYWQHNIAYTDVIDTVDYFRLQLEDFVQAILAGREPMVNGEEASASIAIIEECYCKAERLKQVWVDATLERLKAALPDTVNQYAGSEPCGTSAIGTVYVR